MNKIRQIQELNRRELEAGVSPSGSWHRDYDTAWIYIGGLPFSLSEGDIITIFSQFGEPVHINLVRDKETGKSKGFAFLKYEDQRSTDLAVDNLAGAKILDRPITVDHTNYKKKDDEDLGDNTDGFSIEKDPKANRDDEPSASGQKILNDVKKERPLIKEEIELARLIQDHDPEDPMKDYLIQQKKEEIATALKEEEHRSHRSREKDQGQKRQRHSRREKYENLEIRDEARASHVERRRSNRQRGESDRDSRRQNRHGDRNPTIDYSHSGVRRDRSRSP